MHEASGHSGRRYLIIGAAGGIGTSLCERLAREGATLFLAGRDLARLEALAGRLGEAAAGVATLDAARFAEADAVADQAARAMGGLEGVANLAGSIMLKAAHQTSEAEFAGVMQQNAATAFAVLRAAARVLRAGEGDRSVVLMSSTAARVGLPNHEAVAAAKGAVIGLTLAAAATYAGTIRVNCVAPGLTRTPMARGVLSSEAAEKASIAMHPAGRLGEPADVAAPAAWLLGTQASWVTGQTIGVDGGLATVRGRVKM